MEKPQIPGYEIGDLLGRGGGGAVFRATQVELDRPVALKVLTHTSDGTDAQQRRRFFREAKVLAQLEHPHLVKIFDFGGLDDVPWIAMELFGGGTLADRLRSRPVSREGGLDLDEVVTLGKEMLSAMSVVHRARVLHRDVKPSNILYRDTGEAVLGDFGIVKVMSPDSTKMTGTLDIVGTMMYLPPEAYRTSQIGPPADIFSLGVVLFEALTGVHPSQGTPFGAGFKPPAIEPLCPKCPPQLQQLLVEMLDTEPEARPDAAQALARLESPAAAAVAVTARGTGRSSGRVTGRPAPAVTVHSSRPRIRPMLALATAVVSLAVGAWLARSPPPPPAVPIEVAASSRTLRALIPDQPVPHQLVLFDASGQLIQALKGSPEGGKLAFELGGLEPGTAYELRVLRMPSTGEGGALGEVVGRMTFRTRSVLEVLALEPTAAGPRLWVKGLPSLHAVAEGATGGVTLTSAPTALPLGSVVRRGADHSARLAIQDGSGGSSEVEVRWKAGDRAASPGRFSEIGVALDGGAPPAMGEAALKKWLVSSEVGWIASVNSTPDSTPVLRPELFHELQNEAGIRTILDVRTDLHPEDATWEARFLSLPWKKGGFPLVTHLNHLFGNMSQFRRPLQMSRESGVWMEHVIERYPGVDFLPPPASALNLISRLAERRIRLMRQALPDLQALHLPAGAPAERWDRLTEALDRIADGGDAKVAVEWIWVLEGSQARRVQQGMEPDHLYLASRSRFPGSKVIYSLDLLLDLEKGAPRPAWARLASLARRLDGMKAAGPVARDPQDLPHLIAPESVTGVTFTGPDRKIHVVHSPEGAKQARFVPWRPLMVAMAQEGPGAGELRYVESVAASADPIPLDLDAGPAYLEELTPVTCSGGGLTLEILHPFDGSGPERRSRTGGP